MTVSITSIAYYTWIELLAVELGMPTKAPSIFTNLFLANSYSLKLFLRSFSPTFLAFEYERQYLGLIACSEYEI